MFQLKDSQTKRELFYSVFYFTRAFNDWMKPIHIEKDNLLHSVYQFKC